MGADDSIETILRRIVREELSRALADTKPDPAADEGKRLFTVLEVASMVGASAQYVRNDIRSGRLPASRLGKTKYVVDRDEAMRYATWLRDRGHL